MSQSQDALPTSRFWSRTVRTVEPYVAGEQPRQRMIKLNTNENPYPPSPAVTAALCAVDTARLRLYPDPGSTSLRQQIGKCYGFPEDQVFLGNGSDEILAFCFQAFFDPAGPEEAAASDRKGETNPESDADVVFPDITYSFYPVYARLFGIPFRKVPLNPDMSIPLEALKAPSAGIVLANPNAPTGRGLSRAELAALAESDRNRLLIVDEAYVDFGCDSAIPLLADYDNILVVQTFSKSRALAGLRLGYALGARGLIAALERIRDSFNSYTVDYLAQVAGEAAMADQAWFEETRSHIIKTREQTAECLGRLGFEVIPSQANFLFVRHPQHNGVRLQQVLRSQGILVRRFDQPRIADFLRITIGTDADMAALADALAAAVAPVAAAQTPEL